MLLVAVVDSGINPAHRQVGPVAGGAAFAEFDGRLRVGSGWADELGHGTAVAAAVSENLPAAGWALLSVRVFRRRPDAPPRCLAAGVRWAVENRAGIVNLSAGVPEGTDPEGEALLRTAAAYAASSGALVVAPARSDSGAPLAPGCIAEPDGPVVGVVSDPSLPRGRVERRGGLFAASPAARPLPPLPAGRAASGVSFAVAGVTNAAARHALAEGWESDEAGGNRRSEVWTRFLREP